MRRPLACLLLLLTGCQAYSHRNQPLAAGPEPPPTRASFQIMEQRGAPDVTVILALSGGGSRAAYFGGSVMLALDDLGLLKEVDAISAVSGGALPGTYYCISTDRVPEPEVTLQHGLPGVLPASVRDKVSFDPESGRLKAHAELTPSDRDQLASRCFDDADRRRVDYLYELSQAVPSQRYWGHDEVRDLMRRDYMLRWFGNRLWPANFLTSWFTAYDSSDVMAQTFADNMFDVDWTGRDLVFADLNPGRPNLILNATDATADGPDETGFGQVFTFTDEDFREQLDADIRSFPVAWGVMASAAFPGAFATMTLRDYSAEGERYVHLLDGGNVDNLGLTSTKRVIVEQEARPAEERPRAYVVICVDAYTRSGVDGEDPDPRTVFDRAIDSNFLVAVDSLLATNRARLLDEFRNARLHLSTDENTTTRTYRAEVEQQLPDDKLAALMADDEEVEGRVSLLEDDSVVLALPNLVFWHIQFEDVLALESYPRADREELFAALNGIPTNFAFSDAEEQTAAIDRAVKLIVTQNLEKISTILDTIAGG